jgi:hypothetical protein
MNGLKMTNMSQQSIHQNGQELWCRLYNLLRPQTYHLKNKLITIIKPLQQETANIRTANVLSKNIHLVAGIPSITITKKINTKIYVNCRKQTL